MITQRRCVIGMVALMASWGWSHRLMADDTYYGVVASTSKTQIVVKIGTEHLAFIIEKDTEVTLNGASTKLDKIKPGFRVRITAQELGKVRIAKSVAARSPKSRLALERSPWAVADHGYVRLPPGSDGAA